jgi:hypothetical protein
MWGRVAVVRGRRRALRSEWRVLRRQRICLNAAFGASRQPDQEGGTVWKRQCWRPAQRQHNRYSRTHKLAPAATRRHHSTTRRLEDSPTLRSDRTCQAERERVVCRGVRRSPIGIEDERTPGPYTNSPSSALGCPASDGGFLADGQVEREFLTKRGLDDRHRSDRFWF